MEPLDTANEKLIPISAVMERLGIAFTTVWRWMRYGNNGVVLAARKIGGRWYTSEEALQRFCDQSTAVALGENPDQAISNESKQVASTAPSFRHSRDWLARQRDDERALRIAGFDGDGSVFEKSQVSKSLLCDLHEFIEEWMPGGKGEHKTACTAVRHAIFVHAEEILAGKHGRSRSLQAAKSWVESIDLTTCDVLQLTGVGSVAHAEWQELLKDPKFVARIKRPQAIQSEGARQ